MGEQKEKPKNKIVKKPHGDGAEKGDGPAPEVVEYHEVKVIERTVHLRNGVLTVQEKRVEKTKTVEIINRRPEKDAGGHKQLGKSPNTKPKENTVVLKIRLCCDGCFDRIKRSIKKFEGVESVTIDRDKDLVTVKGTMNVKGLVSNLSTEMQRTVVVVPPKKEDDKKKKNRENKEGGGVVKKKEAGGGGRKKLVN